MTTTPTPWPPDDAVEAAMRAFRNDQYDSDEDRMSLAILAALPHLGLAALLNEAARHHEMLTKMAKQGDLWAQEARALHDCATSGRGALRDKITMEADIRRFAPELRYDTDDLVSRLREMAEKLEGGK